MSTTSRVDAVDALRGYALLGLFLVGMVMQRRALFAMAGERRGLWLAVLAGGAVLWGAASLAVPLAVPSGGAPMTGVSLQAAFDEYRALGATVFQVALFVLAWHSSLGRLLGRLLAGFAPAGRMTLTLYVGQSLVAAPLFYGYGLGLWNDLTHAEAALWGLAAFALQVALAALWFRAFRYGPLEWLWRAATRTTLERPVQASPNATRGALNPPGEEEKRAAPRGRPSSSGCNGDQNLFLTVTAHSRGRPGWALSSPAPAARRSNTVR